MDSSGSNARTWAGTLRQSASGKQSLDTAEPLSSTIGAGNVRQSPGVARKLAGSLEHSIGGHLADITEQLNTTAEHLAASRQPTCKDVQLAGIVGQLVSIVGQLARVGAGSQTLGSGIGVQSIDIAEQVKANNMRQSAGTEEQSMDSISRSVSLVSDTVEQLNVPSAHNVQRSGGPTVGQPTNRTMKRSSGEVEKRPDTSGQPADASRQSTGNMQQLSKTPRQWVCFPCVNGVNIKELRKQVTDLKFTRCRMKLFMYENKRNESNDPVISTLSDFNKTINDAERLLDQYRPNPESSTESGWSTNNSYLWNIKAWRVTKILKKLLEIAMSVEMNLNDVNAAVERYLNDVNAAESKRSRRVAATFVDVLTGDKISSIRVHGESIASLKPKLTHAWKTAQEKDAFDDIAIAAVSEDQEHCFFSIQNDLAAMLSFKFNQENNISKRADLLRKRITRRGRTLVILEGVSVDIDLKKVGIPVSNRCKVIIMLRNDEDRLPVDSTKEVMEWLKNVRVGSIAEELVGVSKDRIKKTNKNLGAYDERDIAIKQLGPDVEDWIINLEESVHTIGIRKR